MSIFTQVLSAIGDPNRKANTTQLGQIFAVVQQLGKDNDTSGAQMQQVMSVVGNCVRTALQQKQAEGNEAEVNEIVQQGDGEGLAAFQRLFTPQQQDQVAAVAAQKSGVDAGKIKLLLPTLVPLVLQVLNCGSGEGKASGTNPVLQEFLKGKEGEDGLSSMFKMGRQFLGR